MRPIEIKAEDSVTIIRASDFTGPFFNVNGTGKLAIGATLDEESIGDDITLDGGKTENLTAKAPLINLKGYCIIGSNVTLQSNKNNHYEDVGGTQSDNNIGGGVLVYGGTLKLYGRIIKNSADRCGGGVVMLDGNFVMKGGSRIGDVIYRRWGGHGGRKLYDES